MTKISVTGPKSQLQTVIETLYDLELMDIEEYKGENLETGNPFEEAEELSQTLVHVRSLLSKLPETENYSEAERGLDAVQREVPDLEDRVGDIRKEMESIERDLQEVKNVRKFLRRVKGSGLNFEDLKGTETLDAFVGKIDTAKLEENADTDSFEVFHGDGAEIVIYSPDEDFEQVLASSAREEYTVPQENYSGRIENFLQEKKEEATQLKREKENEKEKLEEISREWQPSLESVEEFLTEKVEKAEAPLKFATTQKAFVAEGWIPSNRFEEVQEVLCEATSGSIHIEEEDWKEKEGENPPVKHDNPSFVQPFESLTNLVSVPKYNEIDPSFIILLTFPAMFGFMIGDAGYGLTSFLVFLAGYKLVPAAGDIFKSLMWASVFTIIFGLVFGDAFGYVIFGSHHNALYALTGWEFLTDIPILFHRAEHLDQVLPVAAAFGVFHVNLGYLLGFYNEFTNHGFVEAFLEKGSWIMLEISAVVFYLYGAILGAPLALVSIALLYKGEGVEGVVEIPSLVSNILSYLRIFGVAVAAVALAKVVNGLAAPLFEMGSILGIIGGVTVLVLGHTFNTFIKIMEGFLQGIRLHYVEMFGKFFEGGGKRYAPFGAKGSA